MLRAPFGDDPPHQYSLINPVSLPLLCQADLEHLLRQRLELQQAHRDYLEMKAHRIQAEKEEEEQYRMQASGERETEGWREGERERSIQDLAKMCSLM